MKSARPIPFVEKAGSGNEACIVMRVWLGQTRVLHYIIEADICSYKKINSSYNSSRHHFLKYRQ